MTRPREGSSLKTMIANLNFIQELKRVVNIHFSSIFEFTVVWFPCVWSWTGQPLRSTECLQVERANTKSNAVYKKRDLKGKTTILNLEEKMRWSFSPCPTFLNRNTQRKKLGSWRTLLQRHKPLKLTFSTSLREVIAEQSKASICVYKAYTFFFFLNDRSFR